jgi:hypothetical protein
MIGQVHPLFDADVVAVGYFPLVTNHHQHFSDKQTRIDGQRNADVLRRVLTKRRQIVVSLHPLPR